MEKLDLLNGIYRAVYNGVLSRIPEVVSVPLGRLAFSLLPMEAISGYADLEQEGNRDCIRLGGKSGQKGLYLESPAIMASCYYQPGILRNLDRLGFGAITTKTITREPRKGNPGRTITREGRTFYNSDGHRNPGMEEFRKTLDGLKGGGMKTPLIVSIAGKDEREYSELASELSGYADALEMNISCVNTDYGCMFTDSYESASKLFSEVREVTDRPLIVKLARPGTGFLPKNLDEIIPAAIDSGIDIINYANTRLTGREEFRRGIGAESGHELFWDTAYGVKKAGEFYGERVSIIAGGGIDSEERAESIMKLGADAVEFLTAFITEGPFFPARINRRLGGGE